jgi:hypothetical protein
LQNYDGNDLFGINHPLVQSKTQELREKISSETCTLDDWSNEGIMQRMFKLYLKKHVPGDEELWHRVINRWHNQTSTIIEIKSFICEVYNDNHEISARELRAWKAIFGAIGCKNITPFEYSNTSDKKIKTIPGISKWFVWDWPITGESAGYIRAKSLPNIGKWTEFSPANISTFCGKINRPNPEYATPTPWLTSLSVKKGTCKIKKI